MFPAISTVTPARRRIFLLAAKNRNKTAAGGETRRLVQLATTPKRIITPPGML
jgi:hypothetical protein